MKLIAVLTTVDSLGKAEVIASALTERKLPACVPQVGALLRIRKGRE